MNSLVALISFAFHAILTIFPGKSYKLNNHLRFNLPILYVRRLAKEDKIFQNPIAAGSDPAVFLQLTAGMG
jgi:hypothetical protein